MNLRDAFGARLAGQLGRPHGAPARLMGTLLDKGNHSAIRAAVDALELHGGEVVADVGFGGGVGLELLLDRVGPSGRVHGVEVSEAMLARAARRFRTAREAGRLELHEAAMDRLPLDDASVDGVITVNTVYFVGDLERAFAELAGVLKPSGRLVVGIRDPRAMARTPVAAHGFRLRPVAEVLGALRARGLRVEHRGVPGKGLRALHLLVATPEG